MSDPKSQRDGSNWARSLGYFTLIVGDIVGFTGAGVGLGYYAWNKWGAPWWVVLLSSLVGLTISMFRLYRMTQRDIE